MTNHPGLRDHIQIAGLTYEVTDFHLNDDHTLTLAVTTVEPYQEASA